MGNSEIVYHMTAVTVLTPELNANKWRHLPLFALQFVSSASLLNITIYSIIYLRQKVRIGNWHFPWKTV